MNILNLQKFILRITNQAELCGVIYGVEKNINLKFTWVM